MCMPTSGETVHCLATEAAHTILRVSAVDRDVEIGYETVVLGSLRGESSSRVRYLLAY